MSEISANKRLILLELNEINFDVVRKYLDLHPGKFKAMERLIGCFHIRTTAEKKYEELEPWIQWVSVHTGQAYQEHGIFRLGDIVGSSVPQFFEELEKRGVRVGGVSPMNAENRLEKPAYFIPDPWTNTPTDGSWWSNALGQAVSQAVNDNARSRITLKSVFSVLLGLMRFAQPHHYRMYCRLVLGSRKSPWRKALVLDLFLHDLHARLFKRMRPQFSVLFLNAGAHIQHHYFFNATPIRDETNFRNPAWYVAADADPVCEMLEVYDRIISEYLDDKSTELIVATGLSQRPYDRIKYYWRLKNHSAFLSRIGVEFDAVAPRMTRDFLVQFSSAEKAASAQRLLESIQVESDEEPVFGKIDNRGDSLFVTLGYPREITDQTRIRVNNQLLPLKPDVAFVAIKNGMHQGDGFAFFTSGVAVAALGDHSHVKELHGTVLRYFTN
jgi:hypothetical protein